jgi:hypothetical protein
MDCFQAYTDFFPVKNLNLKSLGVINFNHFYSHKLLIYCKLRLKGAFTLLKNRPEPI